MHETISRAPGLDSRLSVYCQLRNGSLVELQFIFNPSMLLGCPPFACPDFCYNRLSNLGPVNAQYKLKA